MEEKSLIRKEYIAIRNNIPAEAIMDKSRLIMENILALDAYKACKKMFIFLDMGSEVKTRPIITKAIADGKIVAVPYAVPKSRVMHFIRIENFDNLIKSKYGAYEPEYNEENIVKCDKDTIIIVPGNAFSLDGYRIGYGGGYYDTYTGENESLANIGICFEEQIRTEVPHEAHDRRLDMLVSERRVLRWNS